MWWWCGVALPPHIPMRCWAQHLRPDSMVWPHHTSSIWPLSGAPKIPLYCTEYNRPTTALQCQKHLRLQLLCRGTLAYAMSVWGNRQPPLTWTNKTSDPKVLHHPFWDRGLPLPWRRRAWQNNHPCCCPGQRHWPRAPDSGGGPLCMPLCFWATQTALAALGLFWGAGRSKFTSFLPPHSAATFFQHAYQSHVSIKYPMRALLACINASMACSEACSNAHIAHFNAELAKLDARMACFDANLGEHVGCSGRPVSWQSFSSSGLSF